MPIAYNDKTGEALYLTPQGQWEPTKIAENPQTGERLAYDGSDWKPVGSGGGVGKYLDNIVRQVAGGASANLADEFSAYMTSKTGIGPGYVEGGDNSYDAILSRERARDKKFQDESPVASVAANTAGALIPALSPVVGGTVRATGAAAKSIPVVGESLAASLPKIGNNIAGRMGQNALAGGSMGALWGFGAGEGGFDERLNSAAEGGIMGAGVGAAATPVVEGLSKGAVSLYNYVASKLPSQHADAAFRKAMEAAQRDGVTPDEMLSRLKSGNGDLAFFELGGENMVGLAKAAANVPGPAKQEAAEFVAGRQAGRPGRMLQAVDDTMAPTGAYFDTLDDLLAQRSKDAAPLYDEAFRGGSLAPLETQFQNAFADASGRSSEATKGLAQAQQQLTLARAQVSRAGNDVYAANRALAAEREAMSQVAAAERAVVQAEADKTSILGRLRQAQGDAASNAPGAVWSPRIQEFLDDPIIQQGIRRGLKVQRLEALAEGKPFNPTEFSITGMSEAGEPIIGSVPNLRLLDSAKRGLDDILERKYRNQQTGRLDLDQLGSAIYGVRRELVKQLDDLTGGEQGAYAQARAAWAGPSAAKDALEMGRRFMNNDAEITTKTIARLSDSEKEMFRVGAARALRDMILTDTQTAPGKMAEKKALLWERLRQAFPDEDSFNAFKGKMDAELKMLRNEQAVNPRAGSQTAPLKDAIDDMRLDPGALISAGRNLAEGNKVSALLNAYRGVRDWAKQPPQKVAKELAPVLYNTDLPQNVANVTRLGDTTKKVLEAERRRLELSRLLSGLIGGETGAAYSR